MKAPQFVERGDDPPCFLAERTPLEEALRISEARSAAMLASALDCIITIECNGAVIDWNPAAERTFGYTRAQVLGREIAELIVPPALREAHRRGLARCLATGRGSVLDQRIEIPAMRVDGREFPVELTVTALHVGEQPVFTATIRDISDRKRAEEALQQTEARFQRMVANAPGMVYQFVLHPDGSVEFPFVSDGCREIYGLEPREIQQHPQFLLDTFPAEERVAFDRSVRESAETLGPCKWEGRCVLPSGEEKWIQAASRPERQPNGDVLWDGLLVDITQRKQAETELRNAKEAAEEANRAKSRFLANMSHELRTPLNAIIGFSEILLEQCFGELNPRQTKDVDNILKGGRHLLHLINDILDLSKVEAGRMELECTPFDVSSALSDALTTVKPLAEQKQIGLVTTADTAIPRIVADQKKFHQILFNLLSNAIKFTPEGGSVTVTAQWREPELCVSIVDTGIGIDPRDQERIFREFEQLDSSYSRSQQGTGLGLALTRKLVEMHGGRLSVQSQGAGQGSTFSFVIPQAAHPRHHTEGALDGTA